MSLIDRYADALPVTAKFLVSFALFSVLVIFVGYLGGGYLERQQEESAQRSYRGCADLVLAVTLEGDLELDLTYHLLCYCHSAMEKRTDCLLNLEVLDVE